MKYTGVRERCRGIYSVSAAMMTNRAIDNGSIHHSLWLNCLTNITQTKSLLANRSEFERIRIAPDNFGDSKIKQLWLSLAINKNVVWFQIAVNDRITMRRFDCR